MRTLGSALVVFRKVVFGSVAIRIRNRRRRVARGKRSFERLIKRRFAAAFFFACRRLMHLRCVRLLHSDWKLQRRGLRVASYFPGGKLMNSDTLKGQWHQLKGEVKTQWGKLTDNDL